MGAGLAVATCIHTITHLSSQISAFQCFMEEESSGGEIEKGKKKTEGSAFCFLARVCCCRIADNAVFKTKTSGAGDAPIYVAQQKRTLQLFPPSGKLVEAPFFLSYYKRVFSWFASMLLFTE